MGINASVCRKSAPPRPKIGPVKLELVTPERARQLLENLHPLQRDRSEGEARGLGRDNERGALRTTHQGLAVCPEGKLLDGQGRCEGIYRSGVPAWLYVTYNVPPECMEVIDIGRVRSVTDRARVRGESFTPRHVAALPFYLSGRGGKSVQLTKTERLDLLVKHRKPIAFAVESLPRKKTVGVGEGAVWGCVARAWHTQNRARLALFCAILRDQSEVQNPVKDQAALKFFQWRVVDCRNMNKRPMEGEVYRKCQKALVAFLQGERITYLTELKQEAFVCPHDEAFAQAKETVAA